MSMSIVIFSLQEESGADALKNNRVRDMYGLGVLMKDLFEGTIHICRLGGPQKVDEEIEILFNMYT